MKPTQSQIDATVRDALSQAGNDFIEAANLLRREIGNLPITSALMRRYELAELQLLRQALDGLIKSGLPSEALRVAIRIDKARGLY